MSQQHQKQIKRAFEKGKLEILNKLNETYPDLKTQEDRKIFVKWKEQLQKEIGGGEDDN
jgi:hypothetical protein